jgi:hypothetical protein
MVPGPHRRPFLAIAIGFVVAIASGACGPSAEPSPFPGPEDVVRQVADWPPRPAVAAVIGLALSGCIRDTGPAPIVASEDRGFGVFFVLFGDARTAGICEVRREADGSLRELGGGAGGDSRGRGDAIVPDSLDVAPERSYLMGASPVGTAEVRAAVGSHAVSATLGGELFVLAWPNGTPPTLVVALDADGHEIARLDGDALAKIFAPRCRLSDLQPCSP